MLQLFSNAGQGDAHQTQVTITRFSGQKDEEDALVDLGISSFQLFRWMFEGRPEELRQLFRLILSPTETFVARIGSRVVGTVVVRTHLSDSEADAQLQDFTEQLRKMKNWRTFFLQFLLFVLDYRPQGNEIYIGKLAVADDQRGRGIGKALLRHVYDMATSMHLPYVTLHVKIENSDAKRLYNREGFVDEKTEKFPPLLRPLLYQVYGITGVHFLRKALL